jgi:DNA polymerase-3 subunit delta
MLVEATGADAAKIDSEIEKLALHGTAVTPALLADLVPNARSANIFDLANALGRRDRMRSLDILATLVREGEYLPLALSSLGGQLRTALTCQEANLRDANAIQNQFRLSRGRAEGIARTVAEFPAGRLRKAIDLVARADIALRDTRPDDQTVMEALVWAITA